MDGDLYGWEKSKVDDLPVFSGELVAALTPFHISPLVSASVVDVSELSFHLPVVLHDSSGQFGQFEIYVDGSLMKCKTPRGYSSSDLQSRCTAFRGRIEGFSSGARRRLMRYVARLKQDVKPLFVTLTYPSEFSRSYKEWKNDLDKLARRFHTKYPGGAFIWRLEPQKRGAPHYHLLVYGVVSGGEFIEWCHKAWYESVKSGDLRHLAHGVHVEALRSPRGVRSYVSKYIAKKQTLQPDFSKGVQQDGSEVVDWNQVGRWWGVRYQHNLPKSEVFGGGALSGVESHRLLRAMRRYLGSKGVQVSGVLRSLTMFVESPKQWARAIDGITGCVNVGNGSFMNIGKGIQTT